MLRHRGVDHFHNLQNCLVDWQFFLSRRRLFREIANPAHNIRGSLAVADDAADQLLAFSEFGG
jgi:hypothetical protein